MATVDNHELEIRHLRPPADPSTLTWRMFRDDAFWQAIPAWKDVDEATFLDHRWQDRHAVTSPRKLLDTVRDLVTDDFFRDAEEGFRHAPMAVRVTPYVLALIDWEHADTDPLRRQFIPLRSEQLADHPMLRFDSLAEREDSPVRGLTHRYPDKVLFLALDTCPVYCRFCTRSYAVGLDTEEVEKFHVRPHHERWDRVFAYIEAHPEVEDVVISGGDAYRLKPAQIRQIGERLLAIPHIRRFRYATKGLAILPMKMLTDDAWVDALTDIVERGRRQGVEVALHTHFNHPNEITAITARAAQRLFERGVRVRNQCVFQRNVNDTYEVQAELTRKLSWMGVQPYYVFMHDLVRGTEDLRTPLHTGLRVEKRVRGITAGFNTPAFVVDAPGGGGKRLVHSFEHYDRETGISVFVAPSVKPGFFFYFDPLHSLSESARRDWQDPQRRDEMIAAARRAAEGAVEV